MAMSDLWLHPAVILLLGAVLIPLLHGRVRSVALVVIPVLAFLRVLHLDPGTTHGCIRFLDWSLTFGRVDKLSQVFGYIMTLMCILGSIYSLHVKNPAEQAAAWCYVAGSLGVIYAGDYLVLFLFWELMAFSSVFLIWQRRQPQSIAAGIRYLLVHVFGGVVLLGGIILRYKATGSLAFGPMDVAHPDLATWLIMIGFILNAAVPPLHAWLPDAYSEATVTGSVFLCAFTTKTAVYALCRAFAGMEVLVVLGVIMAIYGVVYAVLENDARKLLAYHIISQVGYMVAGVGLGTQMAINGACAHAFAHILYKGLLFMGTGSVLQMTGKSKFTELGGLYKKMPWAFVFTLIGGLSISAFPLFSGFVSKSMIVAAGFEEHRNTVAFLLLLASAGTFLHTGLKVPYFIWFGKNNCSAETWQRAEDPPWNMRLAMAITAGFCIWIGCYTPYLYKLLPYAVDYHPYTAYHVSETLQILLFTALGFFLFLKPLQPTATISLDMDWFYRMGGRAVQWFVSKPAQAVDTWVGELYRVCGLAGLMVTARASAWFDGRVIDGVVDGFARGVRGVGDRLRHLQTSQLQFNIFSAATVLVVLLVVYLLTLM